MLDDLAADGAEWALCCQDEGGVPWRSLGRDLLAFARADPAGCLALGEAMLDEAYRVVGRASASLRGRMVPAMEIGLAAKAIGGWATASVAGASFMPGILVEKAPLVACAVGAPSLVVAPGKAPVLGPASDEWAGLQMMLRQSGLSGLAWDGQEVGALAPELAKSWGLSGAGSRSEASMEVMERAFARAFLSYGVVQPEGGRDPARRKRL